MDESVESGLQNDDIREYGETVRLPSDKADYMRMSVAEKVRCYPFDDKGTDAAFEMVRTYFEKIGMDTSFDSVYEETKLLTDYYEKLKAEEFIQKQTEQIIEKMDMMGLIQRSFRSIRWMCYLRFLILEIWSILPELRCSIKYVISWGSIWHIKIDMNCSIGYIRRGSEKRSG